MLIDTTKEIEDLQNRLWMERTPQERAEFQAAMFAEGRDVIIASLPSGLSDRQFKSELFLSTYGERLPDDFFDLENV